MENITRDELEIMLASHGKKEEVTIVGSTVPRMNKTDNPYFNRIKKHAVVVGDICFRYKDEVDEQRNREQSLVTVAGHPVSQTVEEFTPQPRTWGEKEDTKKRSGALVYHNDKKYLELLVKQSVSYEYRDENGDLVDKDLVKPFLVKRSKPKTQQTDKEVMVRDYLLSNVVAINLGGKQFKVKG
jgi:hypothetical protein|tara:strand:+ start:305 stop:856 length:552 start_codon:yes stop_codon:yes gene_type:complete